MRVEKKANSLSLEYAHNGQETPIQLAQLCGEGATERGSRRKEEENIRRRGRQGERAQSNIHEFIKMIFIEWRILA